MTFVRLRTTSNGGYRTLWTVSSNMIVIPPQLPINPANQFCVLKIQLPHKSPSLLTFCTKIIRREWVHMETQPDNLQRRSGKRTPEARILPLFLKKMKMSRSILKVTPCGQYCSLIIDDDSPNIQVAGEGYEAMMVDPSKQPIDPGNFSARQY